MDRIDFQTDPNQTFFDKFEFFDSAYAHSVDVYRGIGVQSFDVVEGDGKSLRWVKERQTFQPSPSPHQQNYGEADKKSYSLLNNSLV